MSGKTFGRMCDPTIRRSVAPSERIRTTNCRSRSDSTCERTMRAVDGQPVRPITRTMIPRLCPNSARERDHERKRRHHEEEVRDAHEDAVRPSRVVAGDQADDGTDEYRDRRREQADQQRDPRAGERCAEHVAAELVRSEPVVRGRRLQDVRGCAADRLGVEREQHRPEDRDHGDGGEQHDAHATECVGPHEVPVAPQGRARARAVLEGDLRRRHQASRTRGSSTWYSRSLARFARMTVIAKIKKQASRIG